MSLEWPPLPAEETVSKREAARLLQALDIYESLAVSAESAKEGLDRLAFANRYRELLGIEVTQRHELRAGLQHPDSLIFDGLVVKLHDTFYRLKGEA